LIDLGFPSIESQTVCHEENQPAEHILKNDPTHTARTKHMDVKIKFCGEVLAKKNKNLIKYVPTKFNFADIFTKPLSTVRFRELRSVMVQDLEGITNNSKFLQRTFAVLRDFIQMPFKSPMTSILKSQKCSKLRLALILTSILLNLQILTAGVNYIYILWTTFLFKNFSLNICFIFLWAMFLPEFQLDLLYIFKSF